VNHGCLKKGSLKSTLANRLCLLGDKEVCAIVSSRRYNWKRVVLILNGLSAEQAEIRPCSFKQIRIPSIGIFDMGLLTPVLSMRLPETLACLERTFNHLQESSRAIDGQEPLGNRPMGGTGSMGQIAV